MLAKLVTGTIDPARLDVATLAVQEELVPGFLAQDGAQHGCWMADPASGHVLALTFWRDGEAVARTAVADGIERALVAERIGLRVHTIDVRPVLAAHRAEQADRPLVRWVRMTWVEGVAAALRPRLHDVFGSIAADQATRSGFCGSCWFGDESLGEGCAVSFWERRVDLTDGADASRRRRRRVERELGCRISAVRQYRALAISHAESDRPAPTEELAVADLGGDLVAR